MEARARIAGHPIHPILIPLPIGLWVFSLVADIVYRAGGPPVWDDVAFYTLGGGIVGALLAAVPGFVDFSALHRSRARQLATVHMALNLTIVVLQAVSFWLRTEVLPGAASPFVLSLISVTMLGVSGWIGGEMVYGQGVAIDPEVAIRVREGRESGRGAA